MRAVPHVFLLLRMVGSSGHDMGYMNEITDVAAVIRGRYAGFEVKEGRRE
jgi:hypothetical protein